GLIQRLNAHTPSSAPNAASVVGVARRAVPKMPLETSAMRGTPVTPCCAQPLRNAARRSWRGRRTAYWPLRGQALEPVGPARVGSTRERHIGGGRSLDSVTSLPSSAAPPPT